MRLLFNHELGTRAFSEMKLFSEAEFRETFSAPMRRVALDVEPPCDFWEYFDAIPTEDFEGYNCSEGSVSHAWNDSTCRFQHVLVNSEDKNVFMVLVVDLHSRSVFGHRLLNLNREYGIQFT